jgi:hypothetical protein
MPGVSNLELRESERIITCAPALLKNHHLLIGITIVRDEALILQDTLDYVGNFVDAIVAYDDASTDDTLNILKAHPKVAMVIANSCWQVGLHARLDAETRHRGLLLELVKSNLDAEWIYCFDADERVIGDIRDFLPGLRTTECNGIRIRLFDAYLAPEDQAPLERGQPLLNRRCRFGPEHRDILMLWRNTPKVHFAGQVAREPTGVTHLLTHFDCQHYGKAISIEQWEATCDFYAKHFPPETYGQKWQRRKGQAIHTRSDFALPLYEWGASLFDNAIAMDKAAQALEMQPTERKPGQRSVLLATNHLFGWTGSETLLLALLEGLRTAGCSLTVYVRHLDKTWATNQIAPDIRLVDDLNELRANKFDVAHVQHSACVMDIRAAFPELPIIFSSLGPSAFLEQVPPFDCGIAHYLAISEEVESNLIARGVPESRITIVRNLVNESLFQPTQPINPRPESILVLSNKMDEARKIMLQLAARQIGASIRFIGGTPGTLSQVQLAAAINASDIVVSIGRGVVEAMLSGRVPLVFDIHGCDGLVTPEKLDTLRCFNFSGRHSRHPGSVTDLVREMGRYHQEMGQQLRELATAQFGLNTNLPRLLELYAEISTTRPSLSGEQQQGIAYTARLAWEDQQLSRHYRRVSEDLQKEVRRVKQAVSWRMTAPARAIGNLLRKFAHRWRSDRGA